MDVPPYVTAHVVDVEFDDTEMTTPTMATVAASDEVMLKLLKVAVNGVVVDEPPAPDPKRVTAAIHSQPNERNVIWSEVWKEVSIPESCIYEVIICQCAFNRGS